MPTPHSPNLWSTVSPNLDTTLALGRALAQLLLPGDILALNGDLGAGKTQWVRGLAQGLHVETHAVSSPTFVLAHEYPPLPQSPHHLFLIHIDAYRLNTLSDLESIGWTTHESSNDPLSEIRHNAIVAIEWASRLQPWLGPDFLEINITHLDDHQRHISLLPRGSWLSRADSLRSHMQQTLSQSPSSHPAPSATSASSSPPPSSSTFASSSPASQCPVCKKTCHQQDACFPFCSKRCQLADLGRWLGGSYRISRPLEQRDLEEGVD